MILMPNVFMDQAMLRGSLWGETQNHKTQNTHTEQSKNLSPSLSDTLTSKINPKFPTVQSLARVKYAYFSE